MTWEEDKGRNELNMGIRGRSQISSSRRILVGNNERHG